MKKLLPILILLGAVTAFADDVSVLRKGKLTGTGDLGQEASGDKRCRQNPPCNCRSPRCGFRRDPSPLKQ